MELNTLFTDAQFRTDIIDAMADIYNYQDKVLGGEDNPETKKEFFKRQVKKYLKEIYVAWKIKNNNQTIETIKQTAETDAEDNITI